MRRHEILDRRQPLGDPGPVIKQRARRLKRREIDFDWFAAQSGKPCDRRVIKRSDLPIAEEFPIPRRQHPKAKAGLRQGTKLRPARKRIGGIEAFGKPRNFRRVARGVRRRWKRNPNCGRRERRRLCSANRGSVSSRRCC